MKKIIKSSVCLLACSICACANTVTYSKQTFAFDTVVKSTTYTKNEELLDSLNTLFATLSNEFDTYNAVDGINNVYTINHTNEEVVVSKTLYKALKRAEELRVETGGYFNPYIGNLAEKWKKVLNGEAFPLDGLDKEFALKEMNETSLEFNEANCSVKRIGAGAIDLGAFAKGFALSEAKTLIGDYTTYMIDAGNSSILLGQKTKNPYFTVGLKYLDDAYLSIFNTSVGTSSYYEQYREIEGVTYTHIVNPLTGDAEITYDFAVVVDDDPIISDVYSTVCMLKDLADIPSLNKQVIIAKDKKIVYKTEGLEVFYN